MYPYTTIDVLHWNAQSVSVKCPYCEEIHRHGVALPGRRSSHYHPGSQYEFMLPIDENSELVGYEIDKRKACFVNVGFQTGQEDEDSHFSRGDEGDLADFFGSAMNVSTTNPKSGRLLNFDNDSREVETITLPDGDTFEQKRIHFAISECIFGNLHAITQYLSTSTETKVFLHGRNKTGNTNLITVAAEWNHEMVSLLLQHGTDVNATNNDGRSALMEAALWGRIESVRALLKANADKCLRDREGRRAIDLAQPARRNEKERYQRSPIAAAEKVPERERDRRHIVLLLGDLATKKQHIYTGPLSESERNKYEFRKSQSEKSITLHGPIRSYRVPHIVKTAAVLDRGVQFDLIEATSGWGIDALPPNKETGPYWIKQVFYIASIIGHAFQDAPDPGCDQGIPGQYFASHAEKKLIAYFMDRHVFLPQDKEPDQNLEDSILEVEDSLIEGRRSSSAWAKVCDLEERRAELNLQLFEADDRLLGESYDEQEVKRLKQEIHAIDEELFRLRPNADVIRMRAQEKKKGMLLKREKTQEDLIELSRNEPHIALRRAVILSSNKICEDCNMFHQRVNHFFKLSIEMNWCT